MRKARSGDLARAPACSVNVRFCPTVIEGMEAEGFRGGGVVASAFGDVQVAGVFDGRDDGGADGGQVGRAVAGAAGRPASMGRCNGAGR